MWWYLPQYFYRIDRLAYTDEKSDWYQKMTINYCPLNWSILYNNQLLVNMSCFLTEFTRVCLRPKNILLGSSLAFSLKEDPVRCAKVCNKSWVILGNSYYTGDCTKWIRTKQGPSVTWRSNKSTSKKILYRKSYLDRKKTVLKFTLCSCRWAINAPFGFQLDPG